MYRIRLHGRGGHGMKTAGRIVGSAFFRQGFEVQDAPVYGAERRGAPVFAYVRAARRPIHERGIITRPDLVVVADESLAGMPGVLAGLAGRRAALLVNSDEPPQTWRQRLNLDGPVYTLPLGVEERTELRSIGAACAAAAARLLGAVSRASLEAAIRDELDPLGAEVVRANLEKALWAYDLLLAHAGAVPEGDGDDACGAARPAWIELPLDAASVSAPDIHAPLTSVRTITGAWRTMRPVIEPEHCHRCWWVCSTFCPDGAIAVSPDGMPVVDYDHCKGCLVCVAVCPHHAIRAEPERAAAVTEAGAAPGRPGGGGGAPAMTRALLTGNAAAAWGARLAGVDYVPAFPITPQTEIIETIASWIDAGEMSARMVTLESEHSMLTAAGAAAATGVRVLAATSSQGLLYGMEMLYTIAGWRVPFVLVNVSRGLAAPITLEPDHNDVLAARDSGFLQIHCATCQEVLDVVGAEPLDLARKIERAAKLAGPRLVLALAPCPTGWDYDPRDSIEIGRLAVRTGIWPLKEYVDGRVVHTKVPRPRLPVTEYLERQGRFAHLFRPARDDAALAQIQARVDAYWDAVGGG